MAANDDWPTWPRCQHCHRPTWPNHIDTHETMCGQGVTMCTNFGCPYETQTDAEDGMCWRHTRG